MSKIKGSDLMLFVGGKSIAYATSHTLEISGETVDTSNKDEGSGGWASNEAGTLSWTASSENLYSVDGAGDNYEDLFDLMVAKQPIECIFCKKSQASDTDVPTDGWTAGTASASSPQYKGNGVITSLSLNAPNGEYSTYSLTITGVGKLGKLPAA